MRDKRNNARYSGSVEVVVSELCQSLGGVPIMDWSKLLSEGENYSIEHKSVANREVAKEVAAFASSRGGYVIVGVANDQTIVGLDEPYQNVREKVQNWIHEFVRPAPPYSIVPAVHCGHALLVIAVEPGPEAAYAFSERFYYRNNEQSQPIPASEIRRRFSDAALARELKALAEWVDHSHPKRNVAAAIAGQSDLATLNYDDLLIRLVRDLRQHFAVL
jgi:predicted HTH transcriptional regulator